MRKYIILILTLGYNLSHATTFTPVTIKKQISQSHGVIKGEVSLVESFKRENGEIVTKVELYTDKWIGVDTDNNLVSVYYPGGRVGDEVQLIEGSPRFELGESVVLFTKEINGQHWVQNLGLGKFSVKRVGSNYIMVNQIFPKIVNVGQLSLESFYNLTQRLKNTKFKERIKDKYELNKEKQARAHMQRSKTKRSIASVTPSKDEAEKFEIFWLILILGALGLLFRIKVNKSQ